MIDYTVRLLRLFILFGRNSLGCLNNPYVTYRRLVNEKTERWQTIYIFVLVAGYFIFASLIRTGIRNPYLLTIKFNSLILAGTIGFLGIVFALSFLGRILKQPADLKTLFILWAYSLLPTLIWFFLTSFMYMLLPPPRTLTILGKLYSVIFIAFSLGLIFWKIILYYLTLRFGLRFNLGKIIISSAVLTPILIAYSILMYRLGIFRIPFI